MAINYIRSDSLTPSRVSRRQNLQACWEVCVGGLNLRSIPVLEETIMTKAIVVAAGVFLARSPRMAF